jgi:two-component system LytT family response regulator
MKALIIDDEPKARKLLTILLTDHCPEITEISEAPNLPQGVKAIHQIKPDIVFLDVEMPEYSGLELLDFIDAEQFNFEIIFTTAYAEYAIRAFELSAIDYLLKPLRPDKLKEAVKKVVNSINKNHLNRRIDALRDNFQKNQFNKIAIPNSDGILFINTGEIISIEAQGAYSKVATENDGEILVSKPMSHFAKLLSEEDLFFKPHRSFLINLKFVKQLVKKDGGYIVMENEQIISISKENKDTLIAVMGNL